MTLLDWFAGQAVTGCLATEENSITGWARSAYSLAEAMLLEKRRREAAARKLGKGEIKS
jgi:hypothetical protein